MTRRFRFRSVTICLLLGAAINIMVAWAFAAWRTDWTISSETEELRGATWPHAVPADWPPPGLRFNEAWHGVAISHLWEAGQTSTAPMTNHCQTCFDFGWPCKAMTRWNTWFARTVDGTPRNETPPTHSLHDGLALPQNGRGLFCFAQEARLPLVPVWPGFALNTLFFGGLLWTPTSGRAVLRRWRRRRRGLCESCGYPSPGCDRCPECGAPCHPRPEA